MYYRFQDSHNQPLMDKLSVSQENKHQVTNIFGRQYKKLMEKNKERFFFASLLNNNLLTNVGNISYRSGKKSRNIQKPLTDIFCNNIHLVKIFALSISNYKPSTENVVLNKTFLKAFRAEVVAFIERCKVFKKKKIYINDLLPAVLDKRIEGYNGDLEYITEWCVGTMQPRLGSDKIKK